MSTGARGRPPRRPGRAAWAAALAALACRTPSPAPPEAARPTALITSPRGAATLRLEVADTAARRARGLMGRQHLSPDAGMVFVFPDVAPRHFWMRDTLVPLDLACIDPAGEVQHVIAGARPLDDATLACPGPTRWVLEVAAGTLARLGVAAGSRVTWRHVPEGRR